MNMVTQKIRLDKLLVDRGIAPTLERARALGMNPHDFLQNNDAHSFFQRLGDSVITGPTLTNVNDFRALVIGAA